MPDEPTLWLRFVEGNLLVKGGYLLLLAAVIIALVAIWKRAGSRHPPGVVWLAALVFAAAGYLIVDYGYISLNLRMRNPEAVRQACQQLLRRERSGELSARDPIPEADIPEAVRKLGPRFVVLHDGCVEVEFPPTGLALFWSYVYVPGGATSPLPLRSTFYRDIYAARIVDE